VTPIVLMLVLIISDTHRVNVSADHHCQSSVKSVVTTEITTVISYKVLICEIPRISACKY
jgi:hypothetical protein